MSIKTYLLRCKAENARLLFWIVLNSFCLWANGILSAKALTSLVQQKPQEFLLYCLAIVSVYLIWSLQIRQQTIARERAIQAMNTELRTDIAQCLSKIDTHTFHKENTATYTSWLTNDIQAINDLGFEVLEYMIMQGINFLVGAVTLLSFHPTFAITLLIFGIAMQFIPRVFEHLLQEKSLHFSQKNEELVAHITDVLCGFQVLLSAQRLFLLPNKIKKSSESYAQSKIDYSKIFGNYMACQNLVSMSSQIAILAQAGWLFSLGLVPVGIVTSAQYFASTIFSSLTGFLANASELKACTPIFDKFNQLPVPISTNQKAITFEKELRIEKLTFSYPSQKIFSDLSFILEKGKKYAMIAPSGQGKTTLLKLITKDLPLQKGQIYLDQQSLNSISQYDLSRVIQYLPQLSYLFHESLAFNLGLGQEVDKKRVMALFEKMDLLEWFASLPNGFETVLDEQQAVSGGQAQKLCLVRALLQDKPILLMDESLSAVDTVSRTTIETYLATLPQTILSISHHIDETTHPCYDTILSL